MQDVAEQYVMGEIEVGQLPIEKSLPVITPAEDVEEDTKDLDSAKLDLDRKKHDDEVAIKVAEMIEKKRNNMANEKIGMKKAMAKPKTTKK